MESSKLGEKIRVWAISLGFRLPDGSTPSVNYFALLTATPHRRQLWETIIELIQPRRKIEHARKQILVAQFQYGKNFGRSDLERIADRIELWHKQNELENEFKEKSNAVIKLENNIMAKTSDLLFEICRLAELEKQFEELEEKSLVLKLFSRKEKEIMEVLGNNFCKENPIFNLKNNSEKFGKKLQENLDCFRNELMNVKECKCPLDDSHDCELLHKFEELCKSEITEEFLWEEVIKLKKKMLEELSALLEELNSSEKNILGDKEAEIEKNVNLLITQLKQKMTEKSLQVIINSTQVKLLNLEIENLENRLDLKRPQDRSLSDTISFITLDEMSEPCKKNEKTLKTLKSYLTVVGLKSYQEFLKKELKQLEEECMKTERKLNWKEFKNGKERVQLAAKVFESVVDEINLLKLEEREVKKQIFLHHEKLQSLIRLLEGETERRSEARAVEIAVEKLKLSSEKRIDVLWETSLEAFRTVENCSSRILFECESAPHCLKNYGGEIKQFFSAMLIPPTGEVQNILSKIEKRKQIVNEVKKFISERQRLTILQKKIQDELGSLKYDSRLCEKNFKESDCVLYNIFFKTDELLLETDLIEKILKNWIQQPYKLMIKDSSEGKDLKKYEKQYVKEKNG